MGEEGHTPTILQDKVLQHIVPYLQSIYPLQKCFQLPKPTLENLLFHICSPIKCNFLRIPYKPGVACPNLSLASPNHFCKSGKVGCELSQEPCSGNVVCHDATECEESEATGKLVVEYNEVQGGFTKGGV